MGPPETFSPRHAAAGVLSGLKQARVVVVNGPRQAGKTTLLKRQIHPEIGGTFVSLDDEAELAACLNDPITFLDRPRPVIIDEFQRAGDRLLLAIKRIVDHEDLEGQFLLTGSTRFLTVPTISESLAGRVHIVDLWPFSQGEALELGPNADSFVRRIFQGDPVNVPEDLAPARRSYFERVCLGGYPRAHRAGREKARSFFRNYVQTVTTRDVPEISRIQHVDELPRILRMLAASTGQEIHDSKLAQRLSIDRRTLRANYLPLLETTYLFIQLEAWSRNIASRVARHRKGYLVDSGLASHLLRMDAERLTEPTASAAGALLEGFAVNELIRQRSRFADEIGLSLYHHRSHGGGEVDVIAESDDGRVAAIEVKASQSLQGRDFSELARVRDRLDQLKDMEFIAGIVLYTGRQQLRFGDRLSALPLAALWLPP